MKVTKILCIMLAIAMLCGCICFAACEPSDPNDPNDPNNPNNPNDPNQPNTPMGKTLPVYSTMISEVRDITLLTGPNSVVDTYENWGVGCTDLGFPYYDATNNKMMFWFGDTFSSLNGSKGRWMSNVLGVTSDFDASDGIAFDSFIEGLPGAAKELITSEHGHDTTNNSEYTRIPTGGFEYNGTHYAFYMSIKDWNNGWMCNFCNVAKSTDGGQTFTKMSNLYWCNDSSTNSIASAQAQNLLGVTSADVQKHIAPNFMQIFPFVHDGFVYIFGLKSGRTGGVKLGRVAIEKFEQFDEYEYYYDGQWYKGATGLNKVKEEFDEKSYIVNPQVGEVCVSYNKYLNKFLMTYYTNNAIVMRTSDNLTTWSKAEKIITNAEIVQLYGGFTHEKYMSEDGKTVYFFLSRWYKYEEDGKTPIPNDPEGYNVRVMSFTFK